jgi:hypothetical protein
MRTRSLVAVFTALLALVPIAAKADLYINGKSPQHPQYPLYFHSGSPRCESYGQYGARCGDGIGSKAQVYMRISGQFVGCTLDIERNASPLKTTRWHVALVNDHAKCSMHWEDGNTLTIWATPN